MTETEQTKQTIQFWPRGGLRGALEARSRDDSRAALSSTAQRDAERYYHCLRKTLETVELTEPEASLLCDAINGILMEPHTMPLLWANVDDAVRFGGLDRKWHVDGPALVERLRSLSYAQALAVVDAVERWWSGPFQQPDRTASLREVGLIR
jgi:hypothetical protein